MSRIIFRGPGPCCERRTKTGKRDRQVFVEHGRFRGSSLSLGKPAMEFSDEVLTCIDCGAEFVFTAGEQLFFHDKQFMNDPKHCKQCKAKRARAGRGCVQRRGRRVRSAAAETTVPFKPTQGGQCCAGPAFRRIRKRPFPWPSLAQSRAEEQIAAEAGGESRGSDERGELRPVALTGARARAPAACVG